MSLDLNDPDIRRAMDLGRTAMRQESALPTDHVDADHHYDEDHLAAAKFLYGASPLIRDLFKNMDDGAIAQEKKLIAIAFLIWPAIPELDHAQLTEQFGEASATLAIGYFETSFHGSEFSDMSPLVRKAIRADDAFLRSYGKPIPSEGLLEGIEREMKGLKSRTAPVDVRAAMTRSAAAIPVNYPVSPRSSRIPTHDETEQLYNFRVPTGARPN